MLNHSFKLNYLSKNTKSLFNNVVANSQPLLKTNLVLENNWVYASDETQSTTKQQHNYSLRYILKKKLLQKFNIHNINKSLIGLKFLKNSTSSLNSLKKLLLIGNNHFYSHKIIPNQRRLFLNSNNSSLIYNKLKKFYSNSFSYFRPMYLRSFSKINKNKVFITFKKNRSTNNLINLYHQHIGNNYLIYVMFNSQNVYNIHTIFSCSNSDLTSYLTTKFSHLNQIYAPERILNNLIHPVSTTIFNVDYTSKFILISSKYLYLPHKSNSLLKDADYKQEDTAKLNLSLLWSCFYNTLFLSRTKNISANSLFMSVSYTDQEHFLPTEVFFADIKFGNFYLNELPFRLENKSNNINNIGSLLPLTTKYNSSFFNFLKRRIFSTKSNIAQRLSLLTDVYDHNFKLLNSNCTLDKHFDLKQILNSLPYFKNSSIKSYIYEFSMKKSNRSFYSNDTNSYLTKSFKRLLNSYKKNLSSAIPYFDNSFQPLPKVRHMFISKTICFLSGKDDSSRDTLLRHVYHEESFHQNMFTNNTNKQNLNKLILLKSTTTPLFSHFKKISNFLTLITSPLDLKFILKTSITQNFSSVSYKFLNSIIYSIFAKICARVPGYTNINMTRNNIIPDSSFNFSIFKKVSGSHSDGIFTMSSVPWHYNNIIRFMEFCSGRKILFQFYPFLFQSIEKYYVVTYKRWMTRMSYYERKLGHRFFLEEALHIIHLALNLHDPKIMCTWLKAIIQRISFWKTRSIFRFLKYLFSQYFSLIINEIGAKGLKICLRGKISAAGNSRTRTILYRTGQTSHADSSLKVLNEFMTIGTFTGVMGFQIWIFY